jgi:hypothetical protein
MDTGSSTKPVAGPIAATPRADVTASYRAVPTQLPPEATVQQVSPIEAVRFEPSDDVERRAAMEAVLQRAVQRSLELDEPTKTLVYRTTDMRTGEVVAQLPSEQILRLRAYLREQAPVPRAAREA